MDHSHASWLKRCYLKIFSIIIYDSHFSVGRSHYSTFDRRQDDISYQLILILGQRIKVAQKICIILALVAQIIQQSRAVLGIFGKELYWEIYMKQF